MILHPHRDTPRHHPTSLYGVSWHRRTKKIPFEVAIEGGTEQVIPLRAGGEVTCAAGLHIQGQTHTFTHTRSNARQIVLSSLTRGLVMAMVTAFGTITRFKTSTPCQSRAYSSNKLAWGDYAYD